MNIHFKEIKSSYISMFFKFGLNYNFKTIKNFLKEVQLEVIKF